ncbi:hypothetical protein BC939DRAFT_481605 [Gamsiella multidivaricata]|uniref:uncharacterized protein n=1 Tax=Gamsiella multidivaricata TaxID=101098 RepID=UPI00221E4FBB|nr:uncharacterized protein BC939DRAFT_481605 [Gamsiella multidivaricata]KAI7816936.1 hypothetical protein BC939DRAFT_481605 [Gamsiella multidivaricata]
MTSTFTLYRSRLREWPRLVVALVSLYGIYFATTIILSTSKHIQALDSFADYQHAILPPITLLQDTKHLLFSPPQKQLSFNPGGKDDTSNSSRDKHYKGNNKPHTKENSRRPERDTFLDSYRITPFLFNHFRLVESSAFERDVDGHTEAAAVYALLVIASLSIIDNAIGLMVATRRSLRLTQVALAIWCLRFLFRVLSLASVLFMLLAGHDFRKEHPLPLDLDFSNSNSNNNPNTGTGGGYAEKLSGGMTVMALEIIIALVHGWSLLVLIRDLRNQPRPRTVLARLWIWFCGTRCGQRLGLGRFAEGYHGMGGSMGGSIGGGGSYVRYGDVESMSISSGIGGGGGGGGGGVWEREVAASLGLGGGLLSSASSIRSVAASIPEMMGVGVVGSGRSSICSYSSSEKDMSIK